MHTEREVKAKYSGSEIPKPNTARVRAYCRLLDRVKGGETATYIQLVVEMHTKQEVKAKYGGSEKPNTARVGAYCRLSDRSLISYLEGINCAPVGVY